jgi:hypothetical protein
MAESVVVPTAILTGALDDVEADDCFLKLFATDVTPTAAMVPGDFTEVVGGGYVHKFIKGVTTAAAAQIEGLSRAAACVVTWTAHGMTTGDKVTFADITQADWTALNAEHTITYVGANSFSIAVDTSAYAGDYVPGTDAGTVVETTACAWTEEYANTPPDVILAEQTFTFTGVLTTNLTVYGWYLVKQDLSVIKAAKKLDATFTPSAGGGTLKFTPRVQAGNGTPA